MNHDDTEVGAGNPVLITGFGRFDHYERNVSGEIARSIDGELCLGRRLHGIELPVSWRRSVSTLADAVNERRPSALISFGIAPITTMRIEAKAWNQAGNKFDVDGEMPPTPLAHPDGPEQLATRARPLTIVNAIADARATARDSLLRPELSEDAGDYLCNWIYYHSLRQWRDALAAILFVHIPDSQDAADDEQIRSSCIAVVESVLRGATLKR